MLINFTALNGRGKLDATLGIADTESPPKALDETSAGDWMLPSWESCCCRLRELWLLRDSPESCDMVLSPLVRL